MSDAAVEFNSRNSGLLDDLSRASGNIKSLQDRKAEHMRVLAEVSGRPGPELDAGVLEEINKLERTLELEKRYLFLLKRKFHEFMHDASLVRVEAEGIFFQSVPNFRKLTLKYFDKLSLAGKDVNEILEILIRSNDLQREYVKKSKGGIFTFDHAKAFTNGFANYSAQAKYQETRIAEVLVRLTKAQKELKILGLELKHSFDSISLFNLSTRESKLGLTLFFASMVQHHSPASIIGVFAVIASLFVARQFVK